LEGLQDFWNYFNKYATYAANNGVPTVFRGMTNVDYKLIPSIGRGTEEGTSGHIDILESDILSEFKRLTAPIIESPPKSDFEWLFLAQHYGLPTRLLDWSTNPMVALFFAVECEDDVDGVLHILTEQQVSDQYDLFDYKTADITDEKKQESPILRTIALHHNQGEVVFIRAKYKDQRYLNQKSVFSCHADPFKPLDVKNQVSLVIKKEWKGQIRRHLRTFGICHSYIYPGLEGICREIKKHNFEPVLNGTVKILKPIKLDLNLER